MPSIASASATSQNLSLIDWNIIFQNPFVQYVLSPAIALSIVLFIAYKLLNLGELKQKFVQSLKDVDDLKKDSKKLLSHVDIMKTHLVTNDGLNANLFAPGSPLQLLDKGKKLLQDSRFEEIYKENKTWFLDEIKKNKINTLADIDDASMRVIEKCRDNQKYCNFKEIAFENGVSLDVLLKVLAIYLRDEAAKELL